MRRCPIPSPHPATKRHRFCCTCGNATHGGDFLKRIAISVHGDDLPLIVREYLSQLAYRLLQRCRVHLAFCDIVGGVKFVTFGPVLLPAQRINAHAVDD